MEVKEEGRKLTLGSKEGKFSRLRSGRTNEYAQEVGVEKVKKQRNENYL